MNIKITKKFLQRRIKQNVGKRFHDIETKNEMHVKEVTVDN